MRFIPIRPVLAIVSAFSMLACSLAVGRAASHENTRGVRKDTRIRQELVAVDKQWLHAATIQDTDFLKKLFADGMFEVQRGGIVETGDEMRKAIGMPGRRVRIEIDDVVVRGIYGNTAIITDRTTQEGRAPDGRKVSGQYRVMRLLIKQDGKWRAIGAQMTPLGPSTSAPQITGESRTKLNSGTEGNDLIGLDRQWVNADTNGDTNFLKGLFGERMFQVQADGHVFSAAEMLKEIGLRKPGQFEGYSDEVQVRGIYGATATLTERWVLKGKTADTEGINMQWRATRVFVKQQGKWQAVASALTNIDEP